MRATPIPIEWSSQLPVFASEQFLKAVGDGYGWLGGHDEKGIVHCILPYTIIRKGISRLARFRVETILREGELDIHQEREFLNSAAEFFRAKGVDIIIPATTNTIFRTYPDGADAAPYGSYVIDLSQSEEVLWKNVSRITRQNINTARKSGINVKSGNEHLNATYQLVKETFERSKLPFMSFKSFECFVHGLGEYGKIMIADYQGVIQSYVVFGYSSYCAYAIYAGNVEGQQQGSIKYLLWEAICMFRRLGVRHFDFVGARINPEKGSKEDAINSLKRHLGGKLKQGYMWKYPLHPLKSLAYSYAVRFLRGGDIVDHERHKLIEFRRATAPFGEVCEGA